MQRLFCIRKYYRKKDFSTVAQQKFYILLYNIETNFMMMFKGLGKSRIFKKPIFSLA